MTLIWNLPLNIDVAFCNWLYKFLPPTLKSMRRVSQFIIIIIICYNQNIMVKRQIEIVNYYQISKPQPKKKKKEKKTRVGMVNRQLFVLYYQENLESEAIVALSLGQPFRSSSRHLLIAAVHTTESKNNFIKKTQTTAISLLLNICISICKIKGKMRNWLHPAPTKYSRRRAFGPGGPAASSPLMLSPYAHTNTLSASLLSLPWEKRR